jgi:hypothetical protein
MCPLPLVRHQIRRYKGSSESITYLGHYVENIGNETLHYLEIFNAGETLMMFPIDR